MSAAVTRFGMLDMQVCVPADWTDEQVIAFAEAEYPSGTNGWQIRREGDGALGDDPERQPCASRASYVHVVLDA